MVVNAWMNMSAMAGYQVALQAQADRSAGKLERD
jgi:hypothetical protein